MGATTEEHGTYQIVTNETGRVFRVGEEPEQILGYPRWVVIMAAWLAMCLAGLLEYTWGSLSGSLQAAHGWSIAPTFWLFSIYVIFESFVQIATGLLRNRGILDVRWATIIGGLICGFVAYGWLAASTQIWEAYASYAALGGIGSGMVYSSCINIVAKWYPEKKGWRTGFVNGGWAYGAVPFIFIIGAAGTGSGVGNMSIGTVKTYIIVQGIIMTVGIAVAGWFLKDPPKNWWPKAIDPLNWHKHSTRDLESNPPALRHYTLRQMWSTPQAKWLGIQYALYVGCSLFGVAFYVPFAKAENLGYIGLVGFAGFALTDGGFRPFYGWLSEYIGRRRTMIYAYSGNVVFQLLAYFAGAAHNAPLFAICAVISGGLSGANFPMTAAIVADYYGETNNAVNYGSVYAWKALGGSFAGGGAAFVMTGTFYGTAHYHWILGFFFGAILGALAALTVTFLCKRPSPEQMEAAVRAADERAAQKAKPVAA
ncbi:MAG TPA: MFS transporter [Streptosporangiaceae bacterium]|nr:MFS transporter [Streptosporangiaceae bacterium]